MEVLRFVVSEVSGCEVLGVWVSGCGFGGFGVRVLVGFSIVIFSQVPTLKPENITFVMNYLFFSKMIFCLNSHIWG